MRGRAWLGAAVVGLLALGGCTNEPAAEVATVAGPTATTTPTTTTDLQKEIEFVACMRGKGVADMVDPIPGDTSGRSAVRYMLDVLGKGSDNAFQAALDQCLNLLPPVPEPPPPGTEEIEKSRQFAKCMRENGAPDFPDPAPNGEPVLVPSSSAVEGQLRIIAGVGGFAFALPNPALKPALEQCKTILPDLETILEHV
jgi:hypothetical protein